MTLAAALAFLSAWRPWRSHAQWAFTTAGTLAVVFFVLGWVAPRVLRPLNVLWMMIGVAINAVVSPVVLGAVYLGVLTPFAVVMRLRGRDA